MRIDVFGIVGDAELAQAPPATCEAKASLISIKSKSPILCPSRAIRFQGRRHGPMPIMRGGTAAEAMPRMRARGVRPCVFTAASEARISAAAPSLTPDALPAVTSAGIAERRTSTWRAAPAWYPDADARPGRPWSGLAFAAGDLNRHNFLGKIARLPSPCRRAAASARQTRPDRPATPGNPRRHSRRSPASRSTPYCFFISGLMKRQPMVVS